MSKDAARMTASCPSAISVSPKARPTRWPSASTVAIASVKALAAVRLIVDAAVADEDTATITEFVYHCIWNTNWYSREVVIIGRGGILQDIGREAEEAR